MNNERRMKIAAVLVWATVLATPVPPAAAAPLPARPAHAFVNSVGVCVHFSWEDSVYAQRYVEVKAALAELGVRFVRDVPGDTRSTARHRDLWLSHGVKLNAVVDTRSGSGAAARLDSSRIAGRLAATKSQIGREAIAAFEGPNEYNLMEAEHGYLGWPDDLRRYQQALFAAVKADPALAGLWINGPSLAFPGNPYWYERLGYIDWMVDTNNVHAYSNWQPLGTRIDALFANARPSAPHSPFRITEFGWHTAVNSGAQWVDEATKSKYMVRAMADMVRRTDVDRAFVYQLVDHLPDPERRNPKAQFGLIDIDLNRKRSYFAVRNTLQVLCDEPLAAAPQSLAYRLDGDSAGVRSLLLQKNNRAFYLVLWNEQQSFDRTGPLAVPPRPLTVSFQQPVSLVRSYLPADPVGDVQLGNRPRSAVWHPTSVTVSVPDHLLILEIVPAGVPRPALPGPCRFTAL